MNSTDNPTKLKIRQSVDKIETLEAEKKEIADEIKDAYAELKAFGLNPKAVKQVIKNRKQDQEQLDLFNHEVDLYTLALEGSLTDTDNVVSLNG